MFRLYLLICGSFLVFSSQAQVINPSKLSRINLGELTDPQMRELSGIVASSTSDQLFWTHNDSGDAARIFLIDQQAKLQATYHLEGIKTIDCEDIAWVNINKEFYLILADIGDNLAQRTSIFIHLFKEPARDSTSLVHRIPKAQIQSIELHYPDHPRDAEALFVDPISNQLLVFSKRDFKTGIYVADLAAALKTGHAVLNKQGELPLYFITAADISRDGKQVILKNLLHIYYWEINQGDNWMQGFKNPHQVLPYIPEPQGEAIAFDQDGKSFYTLSERPFGLSSYLYQYKLH